MKFCHYKTADGIEGVCHRSKVEFLLTPKASISVEMIDDDTYAKLVEKWNGVETAPAKAAKKTA